MDVVNKPYNPFVIRQDILSQCMSDIRRQLIDEFGIDKEIVLDYEALSDIKKDLLDTYVAGDEMEYLDEQDYEEYKQSSFGIGRLYSFIHYYNRGMKKNKHQKFFEFFSQ
jgi:hypothetical protein